ncbi:MAG: MFS transporter [Lachnospiraceae bacterium]|nr:MFS transporter [Lachnospiraceae bacterium]
MSKAGSRKRRFNKTLFCLYQSTSDDLMFWCWFDVLILSMNYGFSMTQISLLFSVSFWAALAMKLPANALAKKLGAARCVLLSAALFLSAALLLTFGSTFAVAVVGQSIYLAAGSFQEMATVIAKKAAERDPAHVDYMQLMSTTGVIFSVISLIGAVSMSRLYEINKNLPMYICIGFCLNSCVLAYFISKYDEEDTKESQRTRHETLPGMKMRSFDKTTLSCLFLSVLFMVIFYVSGDYLKIMLENDLSAVTDSGRTVFLFSMILLLSRIVKIVSNLLLYAGRNIKIGQERVISFVVIGVVLISSFGVLSKWGSGYYGIILAASAFLIRVIVFDPFRFSIYDFMLKRLKEDKMIDVLFVQSTGSEISRAVFSTVSTVLLKYYGIHSVMLMLLIISLIFAAGYVVIRRHLVRANGNHKFLRWKKTEIDAADSLTVAVAALLMHYGVVEDTSYTPEKLAEKLTSVEDIDAVDRDIQFSGFHEYQEETLRRLFYAGHPCAIRTVIKEGDQDHWLPVMYLDDDGGVIWNPYSGERFLAELYQIREICCFTVLSDKEILQSFL